MFQSSPTPKGGRYRASQSVQSAANMFQSSPTPKGGRYMVDVDCKIHAICFNPRPPRKVGATGEPTVRNDGACVSILAHPERWALRPKPRPKPRGAIWFQSSPTPKGGRYDFADTFHSTTLDVSILAHPERWALPPRPWSGAHEDGVSILAHPERWALRCPHRSGHRPIYCFNPRPPRKVGATRIDQPQYTLPQVSILAHPERWALRYSPASQSAPCEFQSSPTPKGGRYAGSFTLCQINRRFNPRPPRKVGATSRKWRS